MPAENNLQRTAFRLNIKDLYDSPTRLHRARHSEIASHIREFKLEGALFVCIEFEDSLIRQQGLEV